MRDRRDCLRFFWAKEAAVSSQHCTSSTENWKLQVKLPKLPSSACEVPVRCKAWLVASRKARSGIRCSIKHKIFFREDTLKQHIMLQELVIIIMFICVVRVFFTPLIKILLFKLLDSHLWVWKISSQNTRKISITLPRVFVVISSNLNQLLAANQDLAEGLQWENRAYGIRVCGANRN